MMPCRVDWQLICSCTSEDKASVIRNQRQTFLGMDVCQARQHLPDDLHNHSAVDSCAS